MHYVIIGNSAAGIGAIESIRKVDSEGTITVISEENCIAYARPLIAEYLSDMVKEEDMWYRDEQFYADNKVELKTGTKVVSIDPKSKTVSTEDNQVITYDKLLIGSGGTPFVPYIEGADVEGIYTFVRWDEVKKLKNNIDNIKHALVIGGGLIGLKSAEHLVKAGIKVSLVELAPTVLSQVLDQTAATILQDHFKEQGVNISTENTVNKILSQNGKVTGATLKDGSQIECDAIVIAIGVIPNKGFIEGSGIESNRGILINEKCQTNYPDIFAAGDVAEANDLLLQQKRVLPIWPLAYQQGYNAGYNMAGTDRNYNGGISMNSLEFFHLPIISAGYAKLPDESYKEAFVLNERKKDYKKIITKDNVLYGFIYVNKVDRAGILTGLILDKTDLSEFKDVILNDDFGLIDIPEKIVENKVNKATVVSSCN